MKKLKNSKGLTLAEMLFCVFILSLLAILTVTGAKFVKRTLTAMEERYGAGILAEDLLTVIKEEFHFCTGLIIEDREGAGTDITEVRVSYTSSVYGENTSLKIEPFEPGSPYGYLTIVYRDKVRKEYCPCKSLYKNLWLCPLDDETPVFRWDIDKEGVLVSFGICNEDGEIRWSVEDVPIRLLNISD